MKSDDLSIKSFEPGFRERILDIWERSVLATHHFLTAQDFQAIKHDVGGIDFSAFHVYCSLLDQRLTGFIGVADGKIEMLFIDPDFHGQGHGKQLMQFAMTELGANQVDVNEQNADALAFYEKLGFSVVERTERDDQGRPYPLLRMVLKPSSLD